MASDNKRQETPLRSTGLFVGFLSTPVFELHSSLLRTQTSGKSTCSENVPLERHSARGLPGTANLQRVVHVEPPIGYPPTAEVWAQQHRFWFGVSCCSLSAVFTSETHLYAAVVDLGLNMGPLVSVRREPRTGLKGRSGWSRKVVTKYRAWMSITRAKPCDMASAVPSEKLCLQNSNLR
eukprot:3519833-Amphidinium_carterae.1